MKNKKHIVAFTLLIAASVAFAQSQNVAQNGAKYSFYPNGMLKSKVVSIGPHSYVKILFNENGSIVHQQTIIMNAEEGDQRLYNKQGQLREESRIYIAGHKCDIHLLKRFNENGKMEYYEDSTVQKHFYSNGNIKSIKDSTSEREYYEDGSLKEETKTITIPLSSAKAAVTEKTGNFPANAITPKESLSKNSPRNISKTMSIPSKCEKNIPTPEN